MNKSISPKITALSFGVLVVCFVIAFYVVAWQEPSQAPPGGNVPTPLNVGSTGQSKSGGLILNTGGAENGLIIDKGKICLGADCISSWSQARVTYQMNAASYQSGSTYYSQTKTYSCPEGTSAVMTYCQQRLVAPSCVPGLDACTCSVSGRTAQLKAWVVHYREAQSVSGCDGLIYGLADTCSFHPLENNCQCRLYNCQIEFQCGIKQTVGQ